MKEEQVSGSEWSAKEQLEVDELFAVEGKWHSENSLRSSGRDCVKRKWTLWSNGELRGK